MAAAALLLGGTFRQSDVDPVHGSFQLSRHSLLGSIYSCFSSLNHFKSTLIADADEDSGDLTGVDRKDGKDKEDEKLKDLWDSVQLG